MTKSEAHTEIMRRLRYRHAEDIADAEVYVPNGRNAGSGSQRMDFYAVACSWAQPRNVAYEVKVDRADFVRDDKWPSYLPCCHQFTFITAPGICKPGEIPEEAGWQELSANGKTLVTRKKAPRRVMDANTERLIYKHLLMRHFKKGVPQRDQWAEWLREKREDRKLGHLVSREVKQTLRERVDGVKRENDKMVAAMSHYDSAIAAMKALGLDPERIARMGTYGIDQSLRRTIEAQQTGDVLKEAEKLAKEMNNTAELLNRQRDTLLGLRAKVEEALGAG